MKSFIEFAYTQFHAYVKAVRVDNGFEFLSMRNFFRFRGIEYQRTCVYTQQQNGIVERKHRHILTIAHALLFQSCLPLTFWGECVLTAAYLINRLSSPLLSKKSPFDLLYNRSPSLDHLKVFGCLCYATVVHPTQKFDPCAKRCIFVGYPTSQKGYKLYDMETKKFFVSQDVKFCETIFPFSHVPTQPNFPLKITDSIPLTQSFTPYSTPPTQSFTTYITPPTQSFTPDIPPPNTQ